MKLLAKDLRDLQEKPCEGIRVIVNEQDVADVQAELEGPYGTPYAGGLFRMRLALPSDFPASPPKGWFITKIWCATRASALLLPMQALALHVLRGLPAYS
jgi:ubiquitin-conjugating enzyme E2 S